MTTLTVWPDVELAIRAWLVSHLPGVNVVTETDATFGTSTPNTWMALPLILVQAIPGAATDLYGYNASPSADVYCFGPDKGSARDLALRAHAVMVQIIGQDTGKGVVDDLPEASPPAALNYSNPDVSRYVATYRLTFRPMA